MWIVSLSCTVLNVFLPSATLAFGFVSVVLFSLSHLKQKTYKYLPVERIPLQISRIESFNFTIGRLEALVCTASGRYGVLITEVGGIPWSLLSDGLKRDKVPLSPEQAILLRAWLYKAIVVCIYCIYMGGVLIKICFYIYLWVKLQLRDRLWLHWCMVQINRSLILAYENFFCHFIFKHRLCSWWCEKAWKVKNKWSITN